MHMHGPDFPELVVELVNEGEVPIERINDAVSRILKLKLDLGLFDKPITDFSEYVAFGSKKHKELAYNAASESITLLKNKNRILPIKGNPIATSFGNPHCTFFVDNLKKFSISRIGKETEINPLFPQKANVQIAQVIDDSTIEVKVWERGSGITMASGSSACAVAFSAKRLNLTRDEVQIILDGGSVNVKCQEDGVWISGNTEYVFSGKISSLLFDKSE